MWYEVKQVSGRQRNITLRLTGCLFRDVTPAAITCPRESSSEILKLNSVLWVIQEKMWMTLSWEKDKPFLVLESRNALRFDVPDAAPKDWDGKMWLGAANIGGKFGGHDQPKTFLITLDFDK